MVGRRVEEGIWVPAHFVKLDDIFRSIYHDGNYSANSGEKLNAGNPRAKGVRDVDDRRTVDGGRWLMLNAIFGPCLHHVQLWRSLNGLGDIQALHAFVLLQHAALMIADELKIALLVST